MPPNISKPGPLRLRLNVKQKSEIVNFILKNPEMPLAKVAKIYSERYGQNVTRPVVSKMQKNMDTILNTPDHQES